MRIRKFFETGLIIACLFVVGGCATTKSALSPMQKRHITTKMIEGSYEDAYRATLTVLQDQGYIVKNTDMSSGLIVATADRSTSSGSQVMQSIFFGHVKNKGSEIETTCMLNKLSEKTSEIRMNIREVVYGQNSSWGSSTKQNVTQIYNEKMYQNLFNEIFLEVKRREALNK